MHTIWGGSIRLEKNGEIIRQSRYVSFRNRKEIMDMWIKMYGHRIHDLNLIVAPYYNHSKDYSK